MEPSSCREIHGADQDRRRHVALCRAQPDHAAGGRTAAAKDVPDDERTDDEDDDRQEPPRTDQADDVGNIKRQTGHQEHKQGNP